MSLRVLVKGKDKKIHVCRAWCKWFLDIGVLNL